MAGSALLAPLRANATYRRIWTASLLSNFGLSIQGVGAAWEMTRMTSSPQMVALVQTAAFLPMMLLALPSGAIADMFDRRRVAITGLTFAASSAALLTALAVAGLAGPWILLLFCFLIGAGVALYGPAWQASIGEQVKPEHLPSAVALGSVSYNVARSFGPAIGGLIVAAGGAFVAFGANAVFYLPLIIALVVWRRVQVPSRLPPERIDRAIVSGLRYAMHSPPIRVVLVRTFAAGLTGASLGALMPLVARELLNGDANTFGILLGVNGVGAVAGAAVIGQVRALFAPEKAARIVTLVTALMFAIVGISHNLLLTCIALVIAGSGFMVLVAMLNVSVQLSAPRWVTARMLSCFTCAVTGGIAIGSFGWGWAASQYGTGTALVASGLATAGTILLGVAWPLPHIAGPETEADRRPSDPDVAMPLTNRSGPIVIEIDYRVPADRARDYYDVMQTLRRSRLRSGAFGWSISRNIADPELWTEQYSCPTWGDYLRQRSRATGDDVVLQEKANAFHTGPAEGRVRRRLERPFGSVRWRADTPDLRDEIATAFTP